MVRTPAKSWLASALLGTVILAGLLLLLRRASLPSAADAGAIAAATPAAEIAELASAPAELPTRSAALAGTQVAATRPAPSSGARRLLVRTVDEQGRRLASVQLHVGEDDDCRAVGTTDANGEAVLDLPDSTRWREIVASQRGRASAAADFDAATTAWVELVLTAPLRISGRVLLPDGTPVGADVQVVAQPSDAYLLAHRSPERSFRTPYVLEARTQADGSFVLEDAHPSRLYSLSAGSNGFVQHDPVTGVAAGAEDVVLRVLHGRGALVRFIDPDGSPAHMDRASGSGVGISALVVDMRGAFVRDAWASALQAGVVLPGGKPAPNEWLFVAGAESALGPIEVDLHCEPPGYAPVAIRLALPPLDAGLEVHLVQMRSTARGRGELILRRAGGARTEDADGREGPFAVLTLITSEDRAWHYPVEDSSPAEHRIQHVPFGRYRVRLQLTTSEPLIPAPGELDRWVEIGEAPAIVEYDAARTGTLVIAPRDANGELHRGELRLFLGRGRFDGSQSAEETGFHGGQVVFRRAPYRIPFQAPGPYSLRIDGLHGVGAWHAAQVEPGVARTFEVPMPREGG
ncbi:MAG: hypothetical protein HZA53_17795 [Planctomycetes bacterium]|nr:hypothetical protein [Planctomycetota bacterium]